MSAKKPILIGRLGDHPQVKFLNIEFLLEPVNKTMANTSVNTFSFARNDVNIYHFGLHAGIRCPQTGLHLLRSSHPLASHRRTCRSHV
jgi:hypothetical protein